MPFTQHQQEYKDILNAVKGSSGEKRLASQCISKFFAKFPSFAQEAFDALLDLCEDEDVNIRKQAIRDLSNLCKESKDYVPKVTDSLTQLLLAEDPSELQIVNASLVTLLRLDPKGFISGIFGQIENGDELIRERAIAFLSAKIKTIPEGSWTRELEELLVQHVRKTLGEANQDEFQQLLGMITNLKIMKLVSGQQILVDIITEQIGFSLVGEIDSDFLDKLLFCSKYAIPHFSPYVCSNSYVSFYCSKLLPIIDSLVSEIPGCDLELFQYLAEMIPSLHVTNESHPVDLEKCQAIIFDKLKQYLPLPPSIESTIADEFGENEGDPSLQLTHVECLLYAFHQITKHKPEFLSSDEERLKDFKLRLQYLARGVQNYIKRLKESLSTAKVPKKTAPDQSGPADETEIKQIALKTTTNINTLIRDLFHIPPTFKSTIVPSWKPVTSKGAARKVDDNSTSTSTTKSDNNSSSAGKRKLIEAPANDPPSGNKNQRKQQQPLRQPGPRGRQVFRGRGNFRPRGQFSKRYN